MVCIGNNNRNKEALIVIVHLHIHYNTPIIFFVFVLFNSVRLDFLSYSWKIIFIPNLQYHIKNSRYEHEFLTNFGGNIDMGKITPIKSNIMFACNHANKEFESSKRLKGIHEINMTTVMPRFELFTSCIYSSVLF